ncbi:MAG: hypothetical protein AAF433_20000 [Bacteroidota bacterium]
MFEKELSKIIQGGITENYKNRFSRIYLFVFNEEIIRKNESRNSLKKLVKKLTTHNIQGRKKLLQHQITCNLHLTKIGFDVIGTPEILLPDDPDFRIGPRNSKIRSIFGFYNDFPLNKYSKKDAYHGALIFTHNKIETLKEKSNQFIQEHQCLFSKSVENKNTNIFTRKLEKNDNFGFRDGLSTPKDELSIAAISLIKEPKISQKTTTTYGSYFSRL